MLTVPLIRAIKPADKIKRYYDEKGMYLQVTPSGGMYWRLKYRVGTKEKTFSIGTYPELSLAEARASRDEARKLINTDIDPSQAKKDVVINKLSDQENTFHKFATDWLAMREGKRDDVETLRKLKHDVYPFIGDMPISAITTQIINDRVFSPMVKRGVIETARRCRTYINMIFDFAKSKGLEGVQMPYLKQALPDVVRGNYPALVQPEEVAQLMRSIYKYNGYPTTNTALKLAPLLFLRPSLIQCAEWREFDLEKGYMLIDGEDMKKGEPLIIPLPHQAVTMLKELHELTGNLQYLFPHRSKRGEPMTDGALGQAFKYMGYRGLHSVHGFRATARTILDEVLDIRPDLIEHQLAHAVKDPNGRAYNRTKFLKQRKDMLQTWADYLDELRGGKIIPFPKLAS